MDKIVLADKMHRKAKETFEKAGYIVKECFGNRSKIEEEIEDAVALVVRSSTRVDSDLLSKANRLKIIGRAGVGVDNIDVKEATKRGILVVNSPTANIIAATEHTFALILSLLRKVPSADRSMKDKVWDRNFVGVELYGKTLGVVGFGKIGQRVAARAVAFGMKILVYDPYLSTSFVENKGARSVDLEYLLANSDIVTLHLPMTQETKNLLNRTRLKMIKKGGFLINCARGGIVDEKAAIELLDAGHFAGIGVDVFHEEPPKDWSLPTHPKVVATPHIGAQTREAQEKIADQIAKTVIEALKGSLKVSAINLPFRYSGGSDSFLILANRSAKFLSYLTDGNFDKVDVTVRGLSEDLLLPISISATQGALSTFLGAGVNLVNAVQVAHDRGIKITRSLESGADTYSRLVTVRLVKDTKEWFVSGTVFGDNDIRIVSFQGFRLEFRPFGTLLVLKNFDLPGVLGNVCSVLGKAKINIAEIHLSRRAVGGEAISVIRLDSTPSKEVLSKLEAIENVNSVKLVRIE